MPVDGRDRSYDGSTVALCKHRVVAGTHCPECEKDRAKAAAKAEFEASQPKAIQKDFTPNDFQEFCRSRAGKDFRVAPKQVEWSFALAGEVGELVNKIKKIFFHDHDNNSDDILEELGDIQFYLAMTAESFGFTLADVMRHNVTKLMARYPDGFDPLRSKNRG